MGKNITIKIKSETDDLLAYQLTLDSVSGYIFMKDFQGRYTYVNQKVCDLFEQSKENILGKDDSNFFSLEKSNDIRINDRMVLDQGISIEKEERNIISNTGEVRYYWTIKKPLKDKKGNIIGLSGIATDITEQKLLQLKLNEKQALLDTIINNVDAYIYMKDKDRRFLFINEKTAELFGTSSEAVVGKRSNEVLSDEIADNFDILDNQIISSGEKVSGEELITSDDGDIKYYWSSKVPIKNEQGEVISFIGFSSDITELGRQKHYFEEKSETDELTQLANRRKFMSTSVSELKRVKRNHQPISVILFDIDNFKSVNDRYGHHAGDIVLTQLAQTCLSSMRENDLIARLGGEEFVVLLPDTNIDKALNVGEKLRQKIAEMEVFIKSEDQTVNVTISAGVTQIGVDEDVIGTALIRADKALYQAKNSGRNKVIVSQF